MDNIKQTITGEYIIKAIFYSKPRMITSTTGEPVTGRYGVLFTVGQVTEITGIGWRKVSEIVYSKEIDGFEVRFNEIKKEYPYKGIITIPRLADTEVYYERIVLQ